MDWYPWGPEALDKALEENKPILLSVGYSACHWCHVMERESFENERIAAVMNDRFVCIKVDREERPDIDNLYMKAVQGMIGRGGWPMTVFLTPDAKPFYAGTYFPPEDRGGQPGFLKVLMGTAKAYHERPAEVLDSAEKVAGFLRAGASVDQRVAARADELETAASGLHGLMDAEHGGFGSTPKFPSTLALSFLMGTGWVRADAGRERSIRLAFDRMADGGIYDHIGGGFHRYSVDQVWLVPHFEKMLYDQALLSSAYAEAWKTFRVPKYRSVAVGVLDYVAAEMTAPDGGFYSTQDADSEGVEGKFFVWDPSEIEDILDPEDAALVCAYFDVTDQGNFEGKNILHPVLTIEEAGVRFGKEPIEVQAVIDRATRRLREVREGRVKPSRDEKRLTDWNGLMIGSAALVGALFERPDFLRLAEGAADFVRRELWPEGGLLHFYAEGQARVGAFLDDYAFFGRGCLELYLATGRSEDLDSAVSCAQTLVDSFQNREAGGFYFSADSSDPLLARTADFFDGAVPSGNAVATELLLRLHGLTGDTAFGEVGRFALESRTAQALANPYGAAHLLAVADRHRRGYTSVVIASAAAGRAARNDPEGLAEFARAVSDPTVSVLVLGPDGDGSLACAQGKIAVDGRSTAYVCRGTECLAPVTTVQELEAQLVARD